MKTRGKTLLTTVLILTCTIAVNWAIAQGQVNQQSPVKGQGVTTDLGLNMPYPGLNEREIAKLQQLPLHSIVEASVAPTTKPEETVTDLGAGIPYQGMSSVELEKLGQWQKFFAPSGETGFAPKVEAITDEGAGLPYPGLTEAEKSKLEAATTTNK